MFLSVKNTLRKCVLNSTLSKNTVHQMFAANTCTEYDNTNNHFRTATAISAAKALGGVNHILVVGTNNAAFVEKLSKVSGVDSIISSEGEAFYGLVSEAVVPFVLKMQKELDATHLVATRSSFTLSVTGRLASKLDVNTIATVVEIEGPDVFKKSGHHGKLRARIRSLDKVKILLVEAGSFPMDSLEGGSVPVRQIPSEQFKTDQTTFVNLINNKVSSDLQTAKKVICGGDAFASEKNYDLLVQLGQKIGAAVGSTGSTASFRSVAPHHRIGQNYNIIQPDVYLAFGVMGSPSHIAGVKHSKIIFAVHQNVEAPMFRVAHFFLIADPVEVVKELLDKL